MKRYGRLKNELNKEMRENKIFKQEGNKDISEMTLKLFGLLDEFNKKPLNEQMLNNLMKIQEYIVEARK